MNTPLETVKDVLPRIYGSRIAILLILAVLASSIGIYIGFAWWRDSTPSFDDTLRGAFDRAAAVQAYTQIVETTATLSDRRMRVVGTYRIDRRLQRFASIATTTLTIPSEPRASREHAFTLENIVIDKDIYTRIQTQSTLLAQTIPDSPQWIHFTKGNIPEAFINISPDGPTLDNIQIVQRNGMYLTLDTPSVIESHEGVGLTHYTFTLSKNASTDVGGTLGTLFERIGPLGKVHIWINPQTLAILTMRFDGDKYVSTTTLMQIDSPPDIQAPVLSSE